MKILLATPLYPPDSGGPATEAFVLVKELPAHGIESVVYSFGNVRHLPPGIRHLSYAFGLLKRSRDTNCIVSGDTFSVSLPAALVATILNKPLIVRVPGDYAWEQATQRFGVKDTIEAFQKRRYGFRVETIRYLQKIAMRRAALLVVPSDFLKGIVSQWDVNPNRLIRIYLGLDFSEELIMPSNVSDGKILFSLGRFVPWKGFSLLIDLLPELPKVWRLVIAGDGPTRTSLEKQAAELGVSNRVKFTGVISRSEILGWYKRADAFALNTAQENFSFQVLEGMASGSPVITTNIGSIPELITNGVEGILCTPNNKKEFLEAILSTDTKKDIWKKRTEAAKLKAREFSSKKSIALFAEALKKISRS